MIEERNQNRARRAPNWKMYFNPKAEEVVNKLHQEELVNLPVT